MNGEYSVIKSQIDNIKNMMICLKNQEDAIQAEVDCLVLVKSIASGCLTRKNIIDLINFSRSGILAVSLISFLKYFPEDTEVINEAHS